MRPALLFLTATLFLAACGEKKTAEPATGAAAPADKAAEPAPAEEKIDPQRPLTDLNATLTDLPPELRVGGAEGRSPFEGDRVVGLNAIVRRSLDLIRAFDTAAPGIRATVDKGAAPTASAADRAAAAESVAKVEEMYAQAKAALDDMRKAEAELKASGEYFNENIFYGMVTFVGDVEQELREEKAALSAKLAG